MNSKKDVYIVMLIALVIYLFFTCQIKAQDELEEPAWVDSEENVWIGEKHLLRWQLPPVPEGDFDILKCFEVLASETEEGEYTVVAKTEDLFVEYPHGITGRMTISSAMQNIEFDKGFMRVRAVNSVELRSEMSKPIKFRLDRTGPPPSDKTAIVVLVPPHVQVNVIREEVE